MDRLVMLTVVLLGAGSGCGSSGRTDAPTGKKQIVHSAPDSTPIMSALQPAERGGRAASNALNRIYERTGREFRKAIFYKPSEKTTPEGDRVLAPLLVLEVAEGQVGVPTSVHIGAVEVDASGELSAETSRPAVYVARGLVRLGEAQGQQITHLWATPGRDGRGVAWQGVRTTYGPNRLPVTWEVLNAAGEPVVLFVSEALEQAARRQYGQPLPGRRHAVERGLDERPDVVVARVLSDGPEPMGPTVYLDAAKQEVTTLLCRCMKSQVYDFVENSYFVVLPMELLPDVRVAGEGPFRLESGSVAIHPAPEAPFVQRALRWPAGF